MKALVTGAGGTVGRALCRHLEASGDEVVAWDRRRIPVDDYWAMNGFVLATRPDVLFHLAIASQLTGKEGESWQVNYEWPSELAWIARQANIPFVFTSTVMVFSNDAAGPFTIDSVPDADEGYGDEKRRAELRVRQQNPDARVVRLGWQIGDSPFGNNMLAFLQAQTAGAGRVRASRRWLPACSFLDDTAAALRQVAVQPAGLYQVDSNRSWSFHAIASALSAEHGGAWPVEASDEFVYDQRMLDDRLAVPSLSERLSALRGG